MPGLQFFFLGALDIRSGGQSLPKPPTLKSQSLLAYLIHHRHQPQPRERLSGLFWGDRPESKARQSLATALWHIRRCLPKEMILGDPHMVQFDPKVDHWLDVDRFEAESARREIHHLESAVALYRGAFLEGFYDDWILNERYRLEALFAGALVRLMLGQEAEGKYDAALSTALRLLRHDPVREEAHRLAMRAYCRLGQRNAALEQYHRCRGLVREELGAEPMIETTELHRAILEGRFEVAPLADVVQPVGAGGLQVEGRGRSPLDALAPASLVGRERELATLQECWQKAVGSRGVLVLLRGEAGVGKTRLAEEFASRVRWQGARVLSGRCYEFERLLPYQPIADALRAGLPGLPADELADLAHWAAAEVARLVPEIAERYPGLEAPTAIDSAQEQARLFEGVACFLRQLSRREGLLVVVDDLHWASGSTLQMLHYLTRQLANHKALLLGTLQPEAVDRQHPLRALQRRLGREGRIRSLRLPRLQAEAVEAMVLEMSGAGDVVVPLAGRLYRETEGNPFFLMEIVKALFVAELVRLEGGVWHGDFGRISEGELPLPASLGEAVQARVEGLDDDAQDLLHLAAVIGREFDFDLLNTVWRRGEETTLQAVDDLLRHRLIDEGSGGDGRDYAFTHHKIKELVYSGLHNRWLLHRRVGEAMERLQPNDAAALAWHFERAKEPGRAARYLLQAGQSAKMVFAQTEASAYSDRALVILEEEAARLRDPEALAANQRLRIRVLDERGWGFRLLGDMEAYDRDLAEVARLARALGDPRTLAHFHLREAYTHRWFCRYAQALKVAEDGVRLSQAAADPALEARCQREVAMAARAAGEYDRAQAALERALSLFAGLGDTVFEIHALCNLSTLHWCTGDYDQAMDLSRQALARCEEAGLPLERRLPLGDMGAAAAAAGDIDLARKCLLESLAIAQQIADRTQEILSLGHLGWLCVWQGQAGQALEHLQTALDLAEKIDSRCEQSWLLSGLAAAFCLLGDPSTESGEAQAQAAAHANRALELARVSGRAYDQELAQRILEGLR